MTFVFVFYKSKVSNNNNDNNSNNLYCSEEEGPENLSFKQKSAVFQLLEEQAKQGKLYFMCLSYSDIKNIYLNNTSEKKF